MLGQLLIFAVEVFGSLALAIVVCYTFVRISSIAYYKTKAEYDRSHRQELLNGENNGTEK